MLDPLPVSKYKGHMKTRIRDFGILCQHGFRALPVGDSCVDERRREPLKIDMRFDDERLEARPARKTLLSGNGQLRVVHSGNSGSRPGISHWLEFWRITP
jgi:hypothetical protein